MEGGFALLWVLMAVMAAGGFYLAHRSKQKRRLLLQGWAAHNGLTFSEARDASFDERYPGLSALRQGSKQYAYNVMRGSHQGRPCCAFDYHYETYSTDSKGHRQTHHHHFSGVVVDTGLPLRPLFLRPESVLDRMTEFFGLDDIDFESTEFSRAFHVKAPERKWAFDVLHQATMEFLLGAPRYHVEMAGPWILVRRTGRLKPVDFQGALHVADGILCRLPRYLVQDLKGGSST